MKHSSKDLPFSEKILKYTTYCSPTVTFIIYVVAIIDAQLRFSENLIIAINVVVLHLLLVNLYFTRENRLETESMELTIQELSKAELRKFCPYKLQKKPHRDGYLKIVLEYEDKISLNELNEINNLICTIYSKATSLTRDKEITVDGAKKEIQIEGFNNGSIWEYFSGDIKDFILTGTTLRVTQIYESQANTLKSKIDILHALQNNGNIPKNISDEEFINFIESNDVIKAIKELKKANGKVVSLGVYNSNAELVFHNDEARNITKKV